MPQTPQIEPQYGMGTRNFYMLDMRLIRSAQAKLAAVIGAVRGALDETSASPRSKWLSRN
jgi:hypothetical protein